MSEWRQRLARAVGLRVAVWYAAVFILTATAVGWLAYHLLVVSLERRDHDLLLVKLAEYAEDYDDGGLGDLSQAVAAEQASGSPDSVMVRLVGRGADVLLLSLPRSWSAYDLTRLDVSPGPSPESGDDWQLVPSANGTDGEAARLEVVSRPLGRGVVIQVGRTTLERDRFLAEVRNVFGIIVIAVVAAGLGGGVALTRSALRPLRELRNTVRGIANTGRLDVRVTADRDGDMIDELGQVFNGMLARIETLVAGMRDALDNVAHDLRTPIARLRARAESALASASTEAECRDALAQCVEEADRVIALLSTLMDISEAETGTMRLALGDVPVRDVVADTVALYEDLADDRGIALTSSVTPDLAVRADPQRLQQVLANLVDNSIKYTPAGGRVSVDAAASNGHVTIAVRDTGRGIGPDDLPRIWDRLYRADPEHEHGLGLGLSLVRAVVAAHGGTVDVSSELGKGSTFRLTLPRVGNGSPSPATA
jgi:signal transduction histidine kinase